MPVTVEPGQGAYAATKAGLVQLLRTAAAEIWSARRACQCHFPGSCGDSADRARSRTTPNGTTHTRARARWAAGPGPRSWPAPSSTWPPTPPALSPAPCSRSTAAGLPSMAASIHPVRRQPRSAASGTGPDCRGQGSAFYNDSSRPAPAKGDRPWSMLYQLRPALNARSRRSSITLNRPYSAVSS